jgi:hypothetical protein
MVVEIVQMTLALLIIAPCAAVVLVANRRVKLP